MTEIRDLLSYKLHRVANLLSRGAELRYRREFGVSLWEWRTIALLGRSDEPMSLGQLAKEATIDKSQMSRVVAGLAKRRIVLREAHPGDGRGVQLVLSKVGRRIYQVLIRAAAERDHMVRNCLSDKEAKVLEQALSKIASEAGALIQIEKALK
jgi:DNA-binding MarR family transcriptional regulator